MFEMSCYHRVRMCSQGVLLVQKNQSKSKASSFLKKQKENGRAKQVCLLYVNLPLLHSNGMERILTPLIKRLLNKYILNVPELKLSVWGKRAALIQIERH